MSGMCIGIDLGTTNSVVSGTVEQKIRVFTDEDGRRLHPSVVAFPPSGGRLVGLQGRMRRIIDPANTVFSAKRLMGQPYRAAAVQDAIQKLPYQVDEGDNQEPLIVTRGGRHRVTEISSFVLAHLKEIAEQHLDAQVTHCVVTVPAIFSDSQREATRMACEMAGMKVLRVLNEPTAAALAYGQSRALHQRLAVFDFGGGTFDLTVLAVRGDIFEVLATGGDPFLGGDDMDREIATALAMQFLQEHRFDLRTDPGNIGKLLVIAEQIKMRLTENEVVEEHVSALAHGEGGKPLDLHIQMSRPEFETLVRSIVNKAIKVSQEVLADAGIAPNSIDEVLLAGGASRVPLVQRMVAKLFGRIPKAEINPMEVVAVGAAIHGYNLVDPENNAGGLLMDVTSHALRIATAGGYSEQLIAKNTPIPTESTRVFTTAKDGQSSVRIRVCQGSAPRFDENVEVGELVLAGLRELPRGDLQIEVAFLIDANGICSVTARDLETGQTASATLNFLGLTSQIEVGGPATT